MHVYPSAVVWMRLRLGPIVYIRVCSGTSVGCMWFRVHGYGGMGVRIALSRYLCSGVVVWMRLFSGVSVWTRVYPRSCCLDACLFGCRCLVLCVGFLVPLFGFVCVRVPLSRCLCSGAVVWMRLFSGVTVWIRVYLRSRCLDARVFGCRRLDVCVCFLVPLFGFVCVRELLLDAFVV